jgi:hypothetical protein
MHNVSNTFQYLLQLLITFYNIYIYIYTYTIYIYIYIYIYNIYILYINSTGTGHSEPPLPLEYCENLQFWVPAPPPPLKDWSLYWINKNQSLSFEDCLYGGTGKQAVC